MYVEPMDLIRDKLSQGCTVETVLRLLMARFDLSEKEAQAELNAYFISYKEETAMEPMDLIRDKFSQDCSVETVLHLVMARFDLSEEQAQAEIDSYFRIVDELDRERQTKKEP